jgi:Domain of unknown function (DUF6458)
MGIGLSILLIALGAILRFAVHVSTSGFSIHTIGVILMIVGVIGLIVALFAGSMWTRRGGGTVVREREML